jgi:hypothetical protein
VSLPSAVRVNSSTPPGPYSAAGVANPENVSLNERLGLTGTDAWEVEREVVRHNIHAFPFVKAVGVRAVNARNQPQVLAAFPLRLERRQPRDEYLS